MPTMCIRAGVASNGGTSCSVCPDACRSAGARVSSTLEAASLPGRKEIRGPRADRETGEVSCSRAGCAGLRRHRRRTRSPVRGRASVHPRRRPRRALRPCDTCRRCVRSRSPLARGPKSGPASMSAMLRRVRAASCPRAHSPPSRRPLLRARTSRWPRLTVLFDCERAVADDPGGVADRVGGGAQVE
jgi:hypothetical protein